MMAKSDGKRMIFRGADGNRLVATLHGRSGRPVLFFHGGGQTRHAWDTALAHVSADGARAIAVDQRGHGESAWVKGGNYRFDAFADDVTAVVRQTQEKFGMRPAAVGASLGGIAALLAQSLHPDLLEALVLVDIVPEMDPDGVARIQGFMGANLEGGFATLEDAADAIASYLPKRKRPESLDGLSKNLRLDKDGRYRWHWDPRFLSGAMSVNANAVQLLKFCALSSFELDLPVLLVRGMQSELISEEVARQFVARIPGARYVDIRDAGHMVAGDRNDAFADAVATFLRETVTGGDRAG
jgi:pimeloyl-ACP methyl ester carboxylesterase